MRLVPFILVLLVGFSLAQLSTTPRFENYGGASGIFADPATDSRINPARIGTNSSSVWLPFSLFTSSGNFLAGLQNRFVWNWGIPFEFDFGFNANNNFPNNPNANANTRFGLSVPGIMLQSPEIQGSIPLSVGFGIFAGALGTYGDSQGLSNYLQENVGFEFGLASPDFDLTLSLENIYSQLYKGSQATTAQSTVPSVYARLKSDDFSVVGSYDGGSNPIFMVGGGWQTKLDVTRIGVWGRAYSDTDIWLGSNVETPLAEGLNFLGSWSIYRDDVNGLSLEPLRLALIYRSLPVELSFELPLYFDGNPLQMLKVSAGLTW